jgi:hypothetical protein
MVQNNHSEGSNLVGARLLHAVDVLDTQVKPAELLR